MRRRATIKFIFAILVLILFAAAGVYVLHNKITQQGSISPIEKLLCEVGIALSIFIFVVAITLSYYSIRYRRSNVFLKNMKTKITDLHDDEIIDKANELTVKMLQIKKEYFDRGLNTWHPSYPVLLFSNFFRICIENGQLGKYLSFLAEEYYKPTLSALETLNQNELKDKLEQVYETFMKDKSIEPNVFLWYKLPLKTAIVEYIRKHVEDFGSIKVDQ